jgi:hypothetical protein
MDQITLAGEPAAPDLTSLAHGVEHDAGLQVAEAT